MSGHVLRYFGGGNTAKGFYNLYDSNLHGLDRVFILSGKSHAEKSSLLEKLANEWTGKGFLVEALHSANDPHTLDGFIIRQLGVGVIDGDPPRAIGKEYVGAKWETIDLDAMQNCTKLSSKSKEIDQLKQRRRDALKKAYESYATGLSIHDEWEKIYIDRMDFTKADEVANSLVERLFPSNKKGNGLYITRRFLGAATPEGPVDFVENITAGLKQRFFLKGRAGTGKSTLLRRVVATAEKKGYDFEIYHCGFDPESLDMVLVRELGWAVFDSTSPHEYFPERAGDEVIDMYELTVAPSTDELFAEEIAQIERRYREQMNAGKTYLAEAKQLQTELEGIYKIAIDPERLKEIYVDIHGEIKLLAKDRES